MRLTATHIIYIHLMGLLNVRILAKSIGIASFTTPLVNPEEYYARFGYLPERQGREEYTPEEIEYATRKLQNFMGIPVTGIIDEETINVLNQKRCAVKDFNLIGNETRGRYQYSGSRWPNPNLTWKVNKVQGSFSRSELENLVARAVQEWSRPTFLKFQQSNSLLTELIVDFVVPDGQGNHGDNSPFQSNDLGHAFYPVDGDLHMNMNQQFYTSTYNPFASDLYFVIVHELGHSLGLDHSSISSAVMYPSLSRGQSFRGLHSDDVRGIQFIYGVNYQYSGGYPKIPSLCLLIMGLLSSFTLPN